MTHVTCTDGASYPDALTLGLRYQLLDQDEEKGLLRVLGDNGKTRWFPEALFDLEGGDAVTLSSWQFDSEDFDPWNGNVEVNLVLGDGRRRWSLVATPSCLTEWLSKEGGEPVMQGNHILYVSDLREETVNAALRYLEREGRLEESSQSLS